MMYSNTKVIVVMNKDWIDALTVALGNLVMIWFFIITSRNSSMTSLISVSLIDLLFSI